MTDINPQLTYKRIIKSIKYKINTTSTSWSLFTNRLNCNWNQIFTTFILLYPDRIDTYYHLEKTIISLWKAFSQREDDLLDRDKVKKNCPNWFKSSSMIGYSLYVDLFSKDIKNLIDKIDYFNNLGINYIHLMPLYDINKKESDGGYAVRSYREVNNRLGSMIDLKEFASKLRVNGISLILDFVFNHTSDEHNWALKAKLGNIKYKNFYHIYPDKTIPNRYEESLREIFPTIRQGNFTFNPKLESWVWTTFNSYQWDLNYQNPDVFRYMLKELLFLINIGVDIIRLDAVAFIWKKIGTNCENLPKAHSLIKLFNLCLDIVAPGTLLKSEAIVHPDRVKEYISKDECKLSYNPLLMALLWEAIATRKTELLIKSIKDRHRIPDSCSWCNYLRCHDDIGWTFDDQDAWELGIDPKDHRDFLNRFYTGNFPGSFAKGVPFQKNDITEDMRVSGTLTSLAGVEEAILSEDKIKLQNALNRIVMLYSVIFTIGGIPIIFQGDELGLLNDYSYINDNIKYNDSRWIHRIEIQWDSKTGLPKINNIQKNINIKIRDLIKKRKEIDGFSGNRFTIIPTSNIHLFCYLREYKKYKILIINNFADYETEIDFNEIKHLFLESKVKDIYKEKIVDLSNNLKLSPYEFLWLTT